MNRLKNKKIKTLFRNQMPKYCIYDQAYAPERLPLARRKNDPTVCSRVVFYSFFFLFIL